MGRGLREIEKNSKGLTIQQTFEGRRTEMDAWRRRIKD